MIRELGDLSKKYEVGPKGSISTISTGKGDKGGKSYGLYQIASKTGTLKAFVKQSQFTELKNSPLSSAEFDSAWKKVCFEHPEEFKEEQHHFIKVTHFDPAFKYWTKDLGMYYTNTIGQVLWSMSVQHGKVNTILLNTKTALKNYITLYEELFIKELYTQRTNYVKKYLQGAILKGVLNRYTNELKDALAWAEEEANNKVANKVKPKPEEEKKTEPEKVLPVNKLNPWWKKIFTWG